MLPPRLVLNLSSAYIGRTNIEGMMSNKNTPIVWLVSLSVLVFPRSHDSTTSDLAALRMIFVSSSGSGSDSTSLSSQSSALTFVPRDWRLMLDLPLSLDRCQGRAVGRLRSHIRLFSSHSDKAACSLWPRILTRSNRSIHSDSACMTSFVFPIQRRIFSRSKSDGVSNEAICFTRHKRSAVICSQYRLQALGLGNSMTTYRTL